jgi:hypothetical protein
MARNRKSRQVMQLAEATPEFREAVELREENGALREAVIELKESMAEVQLALDNVGWNPIGEDLDMQEIPLASIKKFTQVTRALATINPLAKRGIAVRTAYIWGNGITLEGLEETHEFAKSAVNKKYLLSDKAWIELEFCLATDGNFFLLVNKPKQTVQRIPLHQITGTVSNPDNAEEIWFYKREWKRVVTNSKNEEKETAMEVYYPAIDYDEANGKPRTFKGKKVVWEERIAGHSVNKQTGWKWGVPDLLPILFWAKAHKEFLESQATLVKAYSRYAFKVTANTAAGAKATATKIGASPSADMQGNPQGTGGTAVVGMGNNIQALGRTGGSVDFKEGLPLAGYVAAGLSVPLNELTADAGDANRSSAETLSSSNEKVMQARQAEHKMFFESIFEYLGIKVKVSFPKIEEEAAYRQIQSIVSLLPLNLFSDKEMRRLIVRVLDLQWADPEKVPTEDELGNLILAHKQATELADKAAEQAKELAASKPAPGAGGVPGAPGKNGGPKGKPTVKKAASTAKSYGDNSYRSDATKAAR